MISKQEPAIDVRGLTKKYRQHAVLNGLTFSVKAGTIYGLLGPNGAGKSTAMKIMSTLSRPDNGEVKICGLDVIRYPEEVRRKIGCVAQHSSVDSGGTARENLMLQGRLYGIKGTALKSRVAELLERFNLVEAANRLSGTYSGGMKRKLDLAMGLLHRPQILFLDEPTTGLDPEARAALWDEIRRLSHEEGMTVLLTTHYLEEVDHLTDHLAIVDQGKAVVTGTAEALKGELQEDIIQVEMVEPATHQVLHEILEPVNRIHETVLKGKVLYVRSDHGAEVLPLVMNLLEASGLKAASASISRPTLDDVYLKYTGRSFKEANREEKQI